MRKSPLYSIFIFISLLILYYPAKGQVAEGNLLYNWKDDTLVGSAQYGNIYNEVWGLSVNDTEYAIIGSTAGTHFINVTDPMSPSQDFFVKGASYGGHIIHRDYHDFAGYLYAVADEDTGVDKSTLQIIDISDLPNSIEVVYDSRDRIRKAHNIFIDSSAATLYAFAVKGGDDPYAPVRIYDISDPVNPTLMESYRFGIDGVEVGHIHDGFVKDDIAFLNAGNDGLLIVDFSDKLAPEVLTHLVGTDYPESGYNHSGWLSEDGNYYYFADETWGTDMKVYDVSDPRNIQLEETFDCGNDSQFSIPHNQIVHCNFLFTSYYYDGLQVYDISDPTSPNRILHYPTSGISPRANYEGAWGVYPFLPSGNILVSDMQNGLFIIENHPNFCTPTATEEELIEDLQTQVIPNPNNGQFVIEAQDEIEQIRLFNANGQVIYESSGQKTKSINIRHFHPGVYFAEITIGQFKLIEKVIIQL